MLVLSSFWELFEVLVIKFLKNLFHLFVFAIAEQQLYVISFLGFDELMKQDGQW